MICGAIAIDNQHTETNNSYLWVAENILQRAFGVPFIYKLWKLESLVLEEDIDTIGTLEIVWKWVMAILRYKI